MREPWPRLARIDPQLLAPVKHPQRESAGGSDGDPGASRAGAGADSANQHGTRTDEMLRGTAARLQCVQCESGKKPRG
jgi:hypothetical protein